MFVALAGAGVLVLAAVVLRTGRGRSARRSLERAPWPVAFAHRGASWRAPENTMEAFRLAEASGAGGLETDVHTTRDGRVVTIHDDGVDRTTDGSGLVREMTFAELSRLDAGYRFTPDGGATYPYRGRGVRVPEFRGVLREFPGLAVNVEIKEDQPGVEEALLRIILAERAEDRVLVAFADAAVARRFRKLARGRVRTAASAREIAVFHYLSRLGLERLIRPSYDALQVPVEHRGRTVVTPRALEAARALGVRMDVWTIDDPAEMRRLLDLGADAIMTNRPEVLREVLRGRPDPGQGVSRGAETGSIG